MNFEIRRQSGAIVPGAVNDPVRSSIGARTAHIANGIKIVFGVEQTKKPGRNRRRLQRSETISRQIS